MKIYALNGTNAVNPVNGTNDVMPVNGTNDVMPVNGGTNAVNPVNGYRYRDEIYTASIPINGGYVCPLALMDPDDVPLEGIPENWTDEDVAAYQLGYLYGDPDALNGDFYGFQGKRKQRREERRAQKDAIRQARTEAKLRRTEARTQKIESGESFLDKLGGGLSSAVSAVGQGFANKLSAVGGAVGETLADEGIDFDPALIDQRNLVTDNTPTAPAPAGVTGWWNGLDTTKKVAVGAGALVAGYLLYKQFSKKKRK